MPNDIFNHPKIFPSNEDGIRRAVNIVNNGGVVILPADTVYGFFCSAVRREAVERVYQSKQREKRKPFVIYTNKDKVSEVVELNEIAQHLINELWPKALSLILHKKAIIADWFTQNNPTVA
ncbi:Sua5/YciO/YrdC/YwlC family protein, partial [Candidatus Thiomargarita nelsonii]